MRPSLYVAQARRLTWTYLLEHEVYGNGFPIFLAAGARAQQDHRPVHLMEARTASPQHLLQPVKKKTRKHGEGTRALARAAQAAARRAHQPDCFDQGPRMPVNNSLACVSRPWRRCQAIRVDFLTDVSSLRLACDTKLHPCSCRSEVSEAVAGVTDHKHKADRCAWRPVLVLLTGNRLQSAREPLLHKLRSRQPGVYRHLWQTWKPDLGR